VSLPRDAQRFRGGVDAAMMIAQCDFDHVALDAVEDGLRFAAGAVTRRGPSGAAGWYWRPRRRGHWGEHRARLGERDDPADFSRSCRMLPGHGKSSSCSTCSGYSRGPSVFSRALRESGTRARISPRRFQSGGTQGDDVEAVEIFAVDRP
jgi:hypothetical protein